jgi:hypothetical protein
VYFIVGGGQAVISVSDPRGVSTDYNIDNWHWPMPVNNLTHPKFLGIVKTQISLLYTTICVCPYNLSEGVRDVLFCKLYQANGYHTDVKGTLWCYASKLPPPKMDIPVF